MTFFREHYGLVIKIHEIASHKLVPIAKDSKNQDKEIILQSKLKDETYLFEYRIMFCLKNKKENLKRILLNDSHI